MEEELNLKGDETLEELDELYVKACHSEAKIHEQLSGFQSEQQRIETQLLRLLAELGGLHVLDTDAREVASAFGFSATLADKVTKEIKSLDLVRSRVATCLQRVEDILDLKLCTDGVQQALQNEEYEQAAAHIHRFLKLDTDVLRMSAANDALGDDFNGSSATEASPFGSASSPPMSPLPDGHHPGTASSLEASVKMLKDAETKLKTIIRKQFDEAVKRNDVASVERFFKIFPLLKLNKEGLDRFSRYLCNQLADSGRSLVRRHLDVDIAHPRYNVRFADASSMLLEEAARVIDVHKPLVETYYGPGNLLEFIRGIQRECDVHFKGMMDEFRANRRISQIIAQLESLNSKASKKSFATLERPDPKALDVILAEISLINVKVEQYIGFLKHRLKVDIEAAMPTPNEVALAVKEANRYVGHTGLVVATQELLGQYVSLEEYFMSEMVSKAISIDTMDEANSLTSTVVDDVFFVTKKCLHRSICSSSEEILCAMINHAACLLDDQYVVVLRNRLKSAAMNASGGFDLMQAYSFVQSTIQTSRGSGTALSSLASASQSVSSGANADLGVIDTKALFGWCVALNNVDVSADYIGLLSNNVLGEATKLFVSPSEQFRAKLDMVMSSFNSTREKLKEVQQGSASQLCQSAIRPKLKPCTELLTNCNMNIREEDYAAYEAEDPWCQNLIRQIDRIFAAMKPMLTPPNHDLLVRGVVQEVANLLERAVLKIPTFSKLGGIQLDKDIRKLITYFTSVASWSVRDKFSRLSQMSMVLSVERETDLTDFFQSESFAWRLTPSEIRQVLSLRVDIPAENIRHIKL